MRRLVGGIAAVLVLVSVTAWLFAPQRRGAMPSIAYSPLPSLEWLIPEDTADAVRADAFRRAQVRIPRSAPISLDDIALSQTTPVTAAPPAEPILCRYAYDEPSGTSAKFDCVLESGHVVKVKYGRNSEIHAETAASALLTALEYPADHVQIAPRLRCVGCPRYPFLMSQLLALAHLPHPLAPDGYDHGYTDFEWVSVESKFPAPAIETAGVKGWAWYELARSEAPRADLDAFRLLAAFLAHWDNKSENQRLVCLDQGPAPPDGACARPLLMMQDVGATFGPTKVNLHAWRDRPIWLDRAECRVTMRDLPFEGATYPDVQISEHGRIQFAQQIAVLSDEDVRKLFLDAKFPEFYSSTDDRRDLDAWVDAFRHRVDQVINAGPCPA